MEDVTPQCKSKASRPDVIATFVSRFDLVEMKRRAGRPQDLADIAGLDASSEGGGERHD